MCGTGWFDLKSFEQSSTASESKFLVKRFCVYYFPVFQYERFGCPVLSGFTDWKVIRLTINYNEWQKIRIMVER
ncbi:MAG: hypothetical protein JWO08_4579 [Verrucomicrobiaceae bacterium]|nr:hypothetical protein [Verrucomicrobiaceae bacterium]